MNFNFHEDLARIRVNEALRKGIASQRAHRSRSKKSMPSIKTIILKFAQALGSIQIRSKKEQPNTPDLKPKLAKR